MVILHILSLAGGFSIEKKGDIYVLTLKDDNKDDYSVKTYRF